MNTPFAAPLAWSNRTVGTPRRFWFMILLQTLGFVYICWRSDGPGALPLTFVLSVFLPVLYLTALRGVLRRATDKTRDVRDSRA